MDTKMASRHMGKTMRGQAAIEYLMNYALAFLVIVVVVGILTFMVFGQTKVEQCNAQTGFVCNDPLPQVFSFQGKDYVNFQLHNKQLQTIEVSKVLCTTDTVQDAKEGDALELTTPVTIISGSSSVFAESSVGQKIPCKAGSNALTLASGQDFRGSIIIWYNYDNDLDKTIKRTTALSETGTVQKG